MNSTLNTGGPALAPTPRQTARRIGRALTDVWLVSLLSLCLWTPVGAQPSADEVDMDNGGDINEVCSGCHGPTGEGGKQGQYPRLAGQPAAFIATQLHLFRDRKRPNMAMIEYVDERQMPDQDIRDISAYLAVIELPSKLPPVDTHAPGFNAYERLMASKRVLQIPRAPGDIAVGKRLYKRECASCHGRQGQGDRAKAVPMLSGQYTNYLWRQVDKLSSGIRIHDPDEPDDRLLTEFSHEELRDIFAYMSVMDD